MCPHFAGRSRVFLPLLPFDLPEQSGALATLLHFNLNVSTNHALEHASNLRHCISSMNVARTCRTTLEKIVAPFAINVQQLGMRRGSMGRRTEQYSSLQSGKRQPPPEQFCLIVLSDIGSLG